MSTIFIDDSCLQGDSYEQCLENVETRVKLFDSLSLMINPIKSNLIQACQQLAFLGFILCSVSMLVKLTDIRPTDIIELCRYIKGQKK